MNAHEKLIKDFLSQHLICALSTTDTSGKPEAAAMAFTEMDDLSIIFQTPNTTRKYENLQNNNHVAIVVGLDVETYVTIQYEGIAEEVADKNRKQISDIHVAKHGDMSAKFAKLLQNKYFIIKPTWIRYADLGSKPAKVFEINF